MILDSSQTNSPKSKSSLPNRVDSTCLTSSVETLPPSTLSASPLPSDFPPSSHPSTLKTLHDSSFSWIQVKLRSLPSWFFPFLFGILLAGLWNNKENLLLRNVNGLETSLLFFRDSLDEIHSHLLDLREAYGLPPSPSSSYDDNNHNNQNYDDLTRKFDFIRDKTKNSFPSHSSDKFDNDFSGIGVTPEDYLPFYENSCPNHHYTLTMITRTPFVAHIANLLTPLEIQHLIRIG